MSELSPEQALELAGKATPGPFAVADSRDVFAAVIAPCRATIAIDFENECDAYFLVQARTNWPRHCQELLSARRRIAELERALRRVKVEADALKTEHCRCHDYLGNPIEGYACSSCEIVHVVDEALQSTEPTK